MIFNCEICGKEASAPRAAKYCKECTAQSKKNGRLEYINTVRGHLAILAVSKMGKRRFNRENVTLEHLESLYAKQKGLCAISGVPMTCHHEWGEKGKITCLTNISIDRIDNNIGYEVGNMQLVCYIVNLMKYTNTETELTWWCRQILQTQEIK